MRANHKETWWEGNSIEPILLQPGQFICSRDTLAEALNRCNPSKHSPKQWYRYLRKLEKLGNVSIKTTNKFSIVTIVNWGKYQYESDYIGQKMSSMRPTDDQQMSTDNNDNNEKNEKNNIYTAYNADFEYLWNIYPRKVAKEQAYEAYLELNPDEELQQRIIASVEEHLELEWEYKIEQFIPYLANFLKAEDGKMK